MKKIVVLDGYTLNPGDLSWDGFQRIAPIEVFDPDRAGENLGCARMSLS
jgi:glycerate dehydrogenase